MSDARNVRRGPQIAVEGVRVTYKGRTVLDVARLELPAGETFAVLGTSGAGKSTLLRVLGLLERPTSGRVLLDGRATGAGDAASRRRMAAVFQQPHLLRGTVERNVACGLRLRRTPSAERARRVAAALERVGLSGREGDSALTLSGGEARRVALARALVLEPDVLFLDEPLASLDPMLKSALVADFARILRDEGVTTVYVTHDQDEAMVVADRVGIMHEGRFVSSGGAEDVMSLPSDEWVAGFLGMEPPMRGHIVSAEEGLVEIACGSASVFGMSPLPAGTEALAAVRPEDVTLFPADVEIPPSSARNRIRGVVADVLPRGSTYRVIVAADGCRVAAMLSRASVAELDIRPGREVIALFKATATRVAGVGVSWMSPDVGSTRR